MVGSLDDTLEDFGGFENSGPSSPYAEILRTVVPVGDNSYGICDGWHRALWVANYLDDTVSKLSMIQGGP